LRGCGRSGHVTYAPEEPELAAQLSATVTAGGEAWQCLRCATFVPGPPDGRGPAAEAPAVARGSQIRSRFILRIFAVERILRALIFAAASYALWYFRHSQSSIERAFDRDMPLLRGTFRQLGYNIDNSKLVGLLRDALTLSEHTITLLAIGAALYAAIEIIEGVGLWLARRWGEYFAMIATSLGLPLEIYDLSRKITPTTLVLLAVNLALVVYLLVTRRLFGIRGGKAAYDARLQEASVLEAAAEAAGLTTAGAAPAPVATAGTDATATETAATEPAMTEQVARERDSQPDPVSAGTQAAGDPQAAAG
jgi:uncharacterized membrane protein (DUF2068 family)